MGFNAITVYVHCALSEPAPGAFDFGGPRNVSAFIDLAWRKFGLLCILRVGPYITGTRSHCCAGARARAQWFGGASAWRVRCVHILWVWLVPC